MRKSNKMTAVLLLLLLVVGSGLLLYPTVANRWNEIHSAQVLADYQQYVDQTDIDKRQRMLAEADAYNQDLAADPLSGNTDSMQVRYHDILNLDGDGLIGSIDIPSIQVTLPIYHDCTDEVLQTAAGHIQWTSLPVGGESTHCVLSGHRGLPSAKLFTDLDMLREGDLFVIQVLDRVMTYEIDSFYTVEPEDLSYLQIEQGEDLCTLVTCTPYGINTHRLLVRGHRVENAEAARTVYVSADAMQIEPVIVAPAVAVPLLILLRVWMSLTDRKRMKR